VTHLLAAEANGAVPVLRDPLWPEGAVRQQLRLAAAARARHPTAGPLLVVATSGSAAAPRLVLRTARSWLDSLDPFTTVTGIGRDDVVWAPGGLSSTLTLFAVWHAMASGLPVLAGQRWRGVVAAGTQARRATVVHCVPALLTDVVAAREAGLLPNLRMAVVAGARLPARLRRRAQSCRLSVVEYYGATELSFVAVDGDGSGLRPFPGVELEIRQDDRIWARSPYLCLEYLDPAAPGPLQHDAAGWCSVGDLATLTPGGTLALRGRGSEAVSVGGHVVLAADVEGVLGAVAGVAEVACLGEPHARLGERVVVAVRPVAGADPVPAMRLAARTLLPAAARPVRYVPLADFPRTSAGKVARAALRDQITRAGRHTRVRPARPTSSPANPL
jgi:acyl-CoA synthetase (AMP-forming)/AMP-acid ligase II